MFVMLMFNAAAAGRRSGQYTVTLTASNAVSSRTVTTDVFVLHSVCKPPYITLLPSDHLQPVSLLQSCHLGDGYGWVSSRTVTTLSLRH